MKWVILTINMYFTDDNRRILITISKLIIKVIDDIIINYI